ncbi:DNA packaging protein, partial [Aneurinibacillus aneurinilyticus]
MSAVAVKTEWKIELATEIRNKMKRLAKKDRAKAEAAKEILFDFEAFCAKCLKIKTKDGSLKRLILNAAQKELVRVVFEQLAAGKPVRIIILKARQMGFSTTAEAIIYYLSSLQEAKNAFIVAQDSSASENLYDMFRLYYDEMQGVFKPMRKRNNSRRLTFENPSNKDVELIKNPGLKSKITVSSAEKKVLARSETIHYLHVSELAFWPDKKKKQHLTSLFAAFSKEPGTVGIIESTAYGMELYKEMWDSAVAGRNDYIPLFFPWFEMPDYRMPVPDDFVLTENEKKIKERFNLDDEQLQWRRFTIRNDFEGDEEMFRQEYPSYPEEAFLVSGRPIFNQEQVQEDIMHAPDPIRKDFDDRLWIWEEPQPGEKYEIGSDVAEGLDEDENDASTAVVFKRRTGEIVATLQCWEEPFDHARLLDKLGRMYNNAKLAPERNNHGHAVLLALMEVFRYPNLYTHRDYDQKGNLLEKEGFPTTQKTRP